MKNIIIIGSGPAGISASLYTVRAGIETTIISNGESALLKTGKIENYYGFSGTGPELYEAGRRNASRLGVSFIDDEVVSVSSEGKITVTTTGGKYFADAVILATGVSRTGAAIPGTRELEGRGVSFCAVCDGFFYRGRDVAVIGAGAYAKSEASELIPLASSVTVLTNGDRPSAEFDKSVRVLTEKIVKIEGTDRVTGILLEDGTHVDAAGVFIALGTAGAEALAKKIGLLTEKGSIMTNPDMSTNVPGVFAAGDNTPGMLQIAKAVCDGAAAGTSAIKYVRSIKNKEDK
ncbi:MAG: NAD(P)/FAD-dependent oxidoreductase [Clostridia bacterium]|nr:NAD(P)/FAD-dependent oxidoreductase [Clostridia bacterium]